MESLIAGIILHVGSQGLGAGKIIFNLPHCKRYLINDYAPTNPYPSAIAININRNDDNLIDKLRLEF